MDRRLAIALPFLTACASGSLGLDGASVGPAPAFTLPDVNPNSPTFETEVAFDDHLGHVTGWYFGHGT